MRDCSFDRLINLLLGGQCYTLVNADLVITGREVADGQQQGGGIADQPVIVAIAALGGADRTAIAAGRIAAITAIAAEHHAAIAADSVPAGPARSCIGPSGVRVDARGIGTVAAGTDVAGDRQVDCTAIA